MEELKRVSEQLAAVEDATALLQGLFAHAPIALQVFDIDGRSVAFNRAVAELLGSVPSLDASLPQDPPSHRDGFADQIRRAAQGETVREVAWHEGRPGQRAAPVAVEVTAFPILDLAGRTRHVGVTYKDVTAELELRRAEIGQREMQEGLSALLQSMGDGVIATDVHGRVTRMNPMAEALTGWSTREAFGQPIEDVFCIENEATQEPIRSPVREILARGTTVGLANHTALVARDGHRRSIADSGAPIRDRRGEVVGVVLVFRDVSDERRAIQDQERLSKQRAHALSRLRKMLEGMPISCVLVEEDLRIGYLNPAAAATLGQPPSELVGRPPSDVIGQDDDLLGRLKAGKPSFHPRTEIVRPDGTRSVCDWYVTPLVPEEEKFAGAIILGVDVTAQAKAEANLRSSERRYRSLVQATSSVVWIHDNEGQFSMPQLGWQQYTGQPWEEQRGLGWANALHPEDREQILSIWRGAQAARSPYEVEGRIYHAGTRSYRYFVARAAPIVGEDRRVLEWIGTLTDVDERRRAHDDLVRLEAHNRQMQEASRLKSEFLANMSHELRTPLNAILGFAELLADHLVEPGSARQDEFIGYILSSGRHLLQLINDVLDLAKVEAGKLEFLPEEVSLSKVVQEVCAILHSTSVSNGVRVETYIEPGLPTARIDPSRFKQVLFNYLSNALKFTPRGGHVSVRVQRWSDAAFRLEVQDDGPGISQENQRRLFIEFQQLDPSTAKKHSGTGLGLALTRRLVEAQGGQVGVRSTPGKGSTFFAVLPLDASHLSAPPPSISSRPTRPDSPRVLVIEDDAEDLRLLRAALEAEGYCVVAARTRAAGLERMQHERFDAIALDLILPDGDGLTLLSALPKSPLNARTPVVVTTVARNRNLAGFVISEVLYKPLDTAKLLLAIGRARIHKSGPGTRVLVVEDDAASQRLMEAALEQLDCQSAVAPHAEAALQLITSLRPDCIVLDLALPDMDGAELLTRLRAMPECNDTPVIIWTMKDLSSEEQTRLLTLAHSILTKGDSGNSSLITQLSEALPPRPR